MGEFSLARNDSEGFNTWMTTLKDQPDILSYSLRPVYMLVSDEARRAGLVSAIDQYLEENAVKTSPRESVCGGSVPNIGSNCCPTVFSRGMLEVTIVRGWNLQGDLTGKTER